MPSEKTVLQAMNHYKGKTFVYYVLLMKVRHKDPNEFKSQVMSFTDIKTVVAKRISGG